MTSGTAAVDNSLPRPSAAGTRAQIHSLLAPRSIAIVGAGSAPGSMGSRAVSAGLNPVLVLPEGSGAVVVDALASREG